MEGRHTLIARKNCPNTLYIGGESQAVVYSLTGEWVDGYDSDQKRNKNPLSVPEDSKSPEPTAAPERDPGPLIPILL